MSDCRPVDSVIDPQGRELWLRAIVSRPPGDEPTALYVVGVASSEVWLNGHRLGANGRPGSSAQSERPGRYQAAFPINDTLWRTENNVAVVRLSSFHGSVRLDHPVPGLLVSAYPWPSSTPWLAVTFVAAGALFAAAFGFGVIYGLRRTGSSLTLAALATVAGAQALLESLRTLVAYDYPLHGWRLLGIWGLSAAFSILLVSWMATRFWPGARRLLIGATAALAAATYLARGFDLKTALVLLAGLAVAVVISGFGVYRRRGGARLALGFLLSFLTAGTLFPNVLIDLTYFLFAAALLLPFLMFEVVRLGRDDQRREAALTQAVARPDCLTVASARGVQRVRLADVVAIVGADDYVEIRLTDGRRLLHAARLDRLEAELPDGFMRVHRSAIANLDHVRGLEREGGRGRLVLLGDQSLPVSRNRLARVRAAVAP